MTPDPIPTCRRDLLLAGGSVAVAALAGCLGDDGDEAAPAEPIDLSDGQVCDVCGMVIADHYGPAGQVFYADGKPDDRSGPARFDSVTELVSYHGSHVARGWELRAAFVTDYSSVDYELHDHDGTPHISTHAAASDFADATDCRFVVDSDVKGAMGDDYIPFSGDDDAAAFADDHGGRVREWDRIVE